LTLDRRILVPFCAQSQLSGVGRQPGDVVWYRRQFSAHAPARLLLHFGAVDYWTTVWVNDVEVARHEGGHIPFSVDISGVADSRTNVLTVRAEDPLGEKTIPRGKQYWKEQPESIFYTATTGIWQTVWLEPLPIAHIRDLRLMPDLGAGAVDFEIVAEGRVELIVRLEGHVVGRWSGLGGRGRVQLEHRVAWHPDSPTLYDVEATLLDTEGKVSDRVGSYFGLRTVEARDGRFWLNGEPLMQRLVLDQGYFPGGLLTAPTDGHLRGDIELAQALGFNGARKHQKVEDPRWLYWADQLGFLVWSEMPSFHEHSDEAERRLMTEWSEVVRLHRDHPSVVVWVPANESFGLQQVEPEVRSRFLVRLYHLTHDLDSTRPVVSNDGWEHALTDLCTLHDYSPPDRLGQNFQTVETALAARAGGHAPYNPGFGYRGEPLIVSEFGGIRLAGSEGWGYSDVEGPLEFARAYEGLIGALITPGPVEGFCFTQLTDVEQEQNGLLTFERKPKVDPSVIRPLTQLAKQRNESC
jgi:beta-galactosidase/beta-glucuronidase